MMKILKLEVQFAHIGFKKCIFKSPGVARSVGGGGGRIDLEGVG